MKRRDKGKHKEEKRMTKERQSKMWTGRRKKLITEEGGTEDI